ncbi:MAG TPA: prolyl oligopeptidase family serine peptidase [Roseiflexaceae bacterium]|nr:prolyl oligopeptidase family serine peptidase [Roseiflexaceae bacterium]HMP41399.1 prolyl oligopeptidase family serine peptidase [Roseiflexaceae bacterium]
MKPEQLLDAMLGLPFIYEAQVSPDGAWVAWSWFQIRPTAAVYVAPTDGSAPPVQLSDVPEDTILVGWSPDSRAVVVRHDHQGDERVQLFRIDIDRPREMHPLTMPSPSYFTDGGALHPNGHWLIYGANVDHATGAEIESTWLYRHDLLSGEQLVLARPQQPGHISPRLSPDGRLVLYHRQDQHPAGRQAWLVGIDGSDDREIISAGADRKLEAAWFPDSRRMLVLAEHDSYRRVGIYDLADSSLTWLIDDPARAIESATIPHGSDVAVIVEVQGARPRCSLLTHDGGNQPIGTITGNLKLLRSVGNNEWVALYYNATQPDDLVRCSLDDLRPEVFLSLTRVWQHTRLRAADLVPAEDFRWRSVDDREIQGWLYRAVGTPRGTIVCIHGGPTHHSEDRIDAQIQFFTAQGFNVLDPNYRGSTGFGLPFQELIKEDGWGGREQDDIRTGIEALIAAGIARAGQVGVTGTSYGGYSSWCQITRCPPELVAAAAPICGMTDLVVDYETTRPDLRSYSIEMLGGRPEDVPERYRERSPIHYVANIRGRLLIVQGLRDPNVTPENVHVVVQALQQAGTEYQTLVFEDEGHGISRLANQRVLLQHLAAFFGDSFR